MRKKTTVIYIGSIYSDVIKNRMIKSGYGLCNHNFETSIIAGLASQSDINLFCLSVPKIPSYPRHYAYLSTKEELFYMGGVEITLIGFTNLPIIKEISACWKNCFHLLKIMKQVDDSVVHLIINTPDIRILVASFIASCLSNKRITRTVIVPDIPAIINSFLKNRVKRYITTCLSKFSMFLTSKCDGLVLLTSQMSQFFKKSNKYIVMEGLVNTSLDLGDNNSNESIGSKEIILYAGSIQIEYGILNLLNAFKLLDSENVELWICGSGNAGQQIIDASRNDTRIKFFGLVDSGEALLLQKKATILVNPRTSEGEFTKYSFPSKTLEYLLAEKSVIINRLPGIPKEYYDYVYIPYDESVESLAKCIQQVLSEDTTYRVMKAKSGREFILKHKNAITQIKRILDFIETYD